MEKILLDTDIGCDMDDMQALAYLLCQRDAEILGITTVTGEAAVRSALADMMCKLAGRDIPIYTGESKTLGGKPFIQSTVSQKEKALLDEFPHRSDFSESGDGAVDFMRDVIESHPGEITLCGIGPLTNIALLFERYPSIPQKLRRLVIMGGRFGKVDAERWGKEEWNIINDADAAKIVLTAAVADVRIFGVEMTSLVFRTDTAAVAESAAKCACLVPFSHAVRTSKEAWYHDVVAVASLFDSDGMSFARGTLDVTPDGGTPFTPDGKGNVLLLTKLDVNLFLKHFYEVVGIPE